MIDHGKKLNRFFFDQELMLQTFLFTSNYNKVFQELKKLNEKIVRMKQSPKIGIATSSFWVFKGNYSFKKLTKYCSKENILAQIFGH